MLADGAELRRIFANDDVAAVTAFPDRDVFGDEDHAAFDVFKELLVTLLMVLFDFADHAEFVGDFGKAFLLGDFGESGIHVGPFVVFAFGGHAKAFRGFGNLAAAEILEPELGVFFFVFGRFEEDGRDLLVAFFLSLGGKIGVFVAGLRFAGKSGLQALFGFGSFEFHRFMFPFGVTQLYTHLRTSVLYILLFHVTDVLVIVFFIDLIEEIFVYTVAEFFFAFRQ